MTDQNLHITPSESVRPVRVTPELLEVEATYASSAGKKPPPHLHPDQDERFEVLDGALRVRVDGADRTLNAGEVLEIPRGTVHQMWNPNGAPARVRWQTMPAGRTLEWFESIHALRADGHVGSNGMPGPLAFGVFLTEFDDVFRLAGAPWPVQRAALSVLALGGRLRGYRRYLKAAGSRASDAPEP